MLKSLALIAALLFPGCSQFAGPPGFSSPQSADFYFTFMWGDFNQGIRHDFFIRGDQAIFLDHHRPKDEVSEDYLAELMPRWKSRKLSKSELADFAAHMKEIGVHSWDWLYPRRNSGFLLCHGSDFYLAIDGMGFDTEVARSCDDPERFYEFHQAVQRLFD